ncbi:MAG: hypothetical protein MJ070_03160 [Lachnospiraceae bacterium]|nr:hypothetical protein [Lachnospiraceae bacterium]
MMKRLTKFRKGYSLVEILMSFALIGVLILMVGGAVTSTFKTATLLQKIPATYFSGQDAVENKIDFYEKKLLRKYNLEKVLAAGGLSDEEESRINAELTALVEELAAAGDGEEVEVGSTTLFGKEVPLYKYKVTLNKTISRDDLEDDYDNTVTLYAGTAGGVRYERPVPVIDTVTISIIGKGSAQEIFNAYSNTTAKVSYTYADINETYQQTVLYRWYVSSGRQRAVWYANGLQGVPEEQLGALMPIYPADFTPVTASGNTEELFVTPDYKGKFILCVATPLSKNGKMGQEVASNLIYIDDIPVKNSSNQDIKYRSVIDPSLMTLYHDSAADCVTIPVGSLLSTSAAPSTTSHDSGFSTVTGIGYSAPYIDLNGAYIDGAEDTKTRFIHFVEDGDNHELIRSRFTYNANDVIFAVVKNNAGEDTSPNFLKVATDHGLFTDTFGFAKMYKTYGPNDRGWCIVRMDMNQYSNILLANFLSLYYYVGDADVDIAELIVVSNPSSSEAKQIAEYLGSKYNINTNNN